MDFHWFFNAIITTTYLYFIKFVTSQEYANEYDGKLYFQCPEDNSHIVEIHSTHHDGHEDRRWKYVCAKGMASNNCPWTDYVNSYDNDMNFECPSNRILAGAESIHDDNYEDRRWMFKCCDVDAGYQQKSCSLMTMNEFDKEMSFRTGGTELAIIGLKSKHNNDYE